MYNLLYYNRVRSGLTQQALAERAGVSRRTVCRLENTQSHPTWQVGLRLSQALNCSPEEVFPVELSL